jgi:hypothetical protein
MGGTAVDDVRFDQLAKTVARTSSRRRLLTRALAAAPLALGVSMLRNQEPIAEAKRRVRATANACKANGQICGEVIGGACCHPLTCTAGPVGVSSCQLACNNDNECRHLYPSFQTSCQPDALACPFIKGGKCCTRQLCLFDVQCQHPFTCQGGLCRK